MNIFLDDLRPAPTRFELARTVEEAISLFKSCANRGEQINIVSLDHDLGGYDGTYTKTGYDLCKWLVEHWYYDVNAEIPKQVFLHTSNPVGRQNMYQLLTRTGPTGVMRVHYGPMPWREEE